MAPSPATRLARPRISSNSSAIAPPWTLDLYYLRTRLLQVLAQPGAIAAGTLDPN